MHRYTGHLGRINAVALSPDARRAAAASDDGGISLCYLEDDEWRVLSGHEGPVLSLAFSPCGTLLVSGGADGVVLVWDLVLGQAIRRWSGPSSGVTALSCGAGSDGMFVVLAGADGTLSWYRLHTLAELLTWTHGARMPREFRCAERRSFLLDPPCDEYGNPVPLPPPPPARPPVPARPVPASVALPVPRLELAPGDSRFDAVQVGRSREWRVTVSPGTTATFVMIAAGIDLEPRLTLRAPEGGPVLAVTEPAADRRAQIGPVGSGSYRLVVDGIRGDGGYILTYKPEPMEPS
jgi:hypothetical protein